MKSKPDNAARADSIAARRAACGYGVSQMTCASCRWCNHLNGWCDKNDFHVNLDRGFCRDFDYIMVDRSKVLKKVKGKGQGQQRTQNSIVGPRASYRKTITRRTK